MYKLKEEYKNSYVSRQGNFFKLEVVRQDQVEALDLEKYFDTVKSKKSKPTIKEHTPKDK